MLSSHLRQDLPSGLLSSALPTKTSYALVFLPCVLHALSITFSFIWSSWQYLAPRYAIISTLVLRPDIPFRNLFSNTFSILSRISDRRRVLDCQLDLLDYSVQLQLQRITMYTLYNTSVELDTRLATVPQPVFHYNIRPASIAIDSSLLLRRLLHSIFQQLPGYQPQQLGYQLQPRSNSELRGIWPLGGL
jgi:hypothetical protein